MTQNLLRFTRAALSVTDRIAAFIAEADRIIHAAANAVGRIGEFLHTSSLNLAKKVAEKQALKASTAALRANYLVRRANDQLVLAQLARDEAQHNAERTAIAVAAEKAELGLL